MGIDLFRVTKGKVLKFEKIRGEEFSESEVENILMETQLEPIVGKRILCIGNQIELDNRHRIDILAITPEGRLVIVELKRGFAPREILAQIIDYAATLESMPESVVEQIAREKLGKPLYIKFEEYYGREFNGIDTNAMLYVVARDFPDEVKNAVAYLSEYEVPVVVVAFELFREGDELYMVTKTISGESDLIEESSEYVSRYKSSDRRFMKKLAEVLEEKFGEWLDGFELRERSKFKDYSARRGCNTSAFSDCVTSEMKLQICVQAWRDNENTFLGLFLWTPGSKRDRKQFLRLLEQEHIRKTVSKLGMQIDYNPQDPHIVYYFDDWKDDKGYIREDFINNIVNRIDQTKPLIEKLLSTG